MIDLTYPLKPIPEWDMPAGLFLVWPHKLNDCINTPGIIDNYCSLLSAIPPEIGLNIIEINIVQATHARDSIIRLMREPFL